jgi:hypothetical protein
VQQHLSGCQETACICRQAQAKRHEVFEVELLARAEKTVASMVRLVEIELELKKRPIAGISKLLQINREELWFFEQGVMQMSIEHAMVLFSRMVLD